MPPATLFNYIALRAIIAIGGLFAILASLVMLVDFIENLRFAGKAAGGDFGLALSLTILKAPSLTQTLIPFVFLFGSIWMFHQLNKRSEISVMRSAGLSVWRLIGPAALIASISGLVIITIIDPLSAGLRGQAELLKNRNEGADRNLVQVFGDGIWLRQQDNTKKLIINAKNFDEERAALEDVTIWRFTLENKFEERIDAEEAYLSGRTLELHDARLRGPGSDRERYTPIFAVETSLSAGNLRERVAPPETMSLWRLPEFILLAEAAGLPTTRYNIRFHDLCSTPLKLLAMVLIAAAFSMRPGRAGAGLELAILSILAGFALYILSEISTALGESGLAPVALAAWTPAIVASLAALTTLLHLEDG
ncbi:LPS export ABC transporter permease LptG [Hyphococcus flavus]|uniref:LPS export ABC transporter permease LptG n=1 Tax=Hyphococcus flavus TaxID=1866326 RepID=A0AAE9ZIL8_9PROT|nr:LPS export ABC transporter permease LptG [Hyphococcus flavus]WDI31671.1 LPS export ABC transporter permease LptG [Hyphococcus flavus]